MGTFHEGGSPENYTIAGARLFLNRLIDGSVTPKQYEGFRDIGNIVDEQFEQASEKLEHYTARSGVRALDASTTKQITEDLVLTLDELNTPNLRDFFRGGDISEVAASTATETVTDETMQLVGTEARILGKGYNASTIVVKDITGVTTHVLDTDYEIVNIIGGYKGIKRKGTGIDSGDLVRVSYKYDVRAHKKFAPGTRIDVTGQALFFGVSKSGQNIIRSFEKVQVTPEGQFKLNSEEYTTFQLRISILDNTEANATEPFGQFQVYGKGASL